VSLSVVQWSTSAGEQSVICTVITRRYTDHIRIIVLYFLDRNFMCYVETLCL
jgi:hypothetical protein